MGTSQAAKRIARWIESDPARPGPANARLKDYGIHVWALVGHLPAAQGDATQVARDYHIPVEAVQGALAFYDEHRSAVDAKLEANAAYAG
jgi:uncharacterized protein (DUF433 family)